MFFLNTHLASVAQLSIEAQLANCSLLTNRTCDLLQKILALNIAIARASVQQVCHATGQLLSDRAAQPAAHVMVAGAAIGPEKFGTGQPAKAVAMLKSVRRNPDALPESLPPSPATSSDNNPES